MQDALSAAVREKQVVLFVGAGLSMNLGLPSFRGLVQQLARSLDFDEDIFETLGNSLLLAEYYKLQGGTPAAVIDWLKEASDKVDVASSELHRLIVELDFPIIYTTNYDTFLEQAYAALERAYLPITKVSDLSSQSSATQIVKLHGDFNEPSSLVLTESSYFDRLDFESPLDIKLRADLLGRSVLFLGYSLEDINIRYMLYKLNQQWERYGELASKPDSYIFLTRPNPVHERVLASWGIHAIVSDCDEPARGLSVFLKQLHSAAV